MKYLLTLLLLLSGAPIFAQTPPTLTLTSNVTKANKTATPVLTWSTVPAATSCTASGAWSGTKAASGTQSFSSIFKTATYTLKCDWAGTPTGGQAVVAWVPPTLNSDGSALTDIGQYRLAYGTSPTNLNQAQLVPASQSSYTVSPLAAGAWYFTVTTIRVNNAAESDPSNMATKTVTASTTGTGTDTETLTITIDPVPNPPTNVTVQ